MNTVNLYRAQQLAISAAIDSGNYCKASDLLRQDLQTFAQLPTESAQTGHNNTLTAPTKCGIIKVMTRRCVRRWKKQQEGKPMKKYYYDSPRGFSNEFAVISVDQTNKHEVEKFAEYYDRYIQSSNINWDLHQITAKRAREIIASERATKRSYERAGLNLCNNPVGATEITTATDYFEEY